MERRSYQPRQFRLADKDARVVTERPARIATTVQLKVVGRRGARAFRWIWFTVVLSLVPIAFAWEFLPAHSGFGPALEHGELAVLAAAVASATIDSSMGVRPVWWRNFAIASCVGILLGASLMLAAALGKSGNLSAQNIVIISIWLLVLGTAVGAITIGLCDEEEVD
jgi:hypothetical protein